MMNETMNENNKTNYTEPMNVQTTSKPDNFILGDIPETNGEKKMELGNIEKIAKEKQIEQPHSVKVAVNAKGQFSGEAKCYGATPEEALERTMKLITNLEVVIKEKNGLNEK